MNHCCICKSVTVVLAIDFGLQPVSNRFISDTKQDEYKYPFQMGFCYTCGLVQLINPPPTAELKPRYAWIHYSEPEEHLDSLVDVMTNLSGITNESSICGVSQFENSTLERLQKKGFTNAWRMEIDKELGACNTFSVIETVHQYLQHKDIQHLTNGRDKPQIVIVRDILEHAHEPLVFMQGLSSMVGPSGYVIFEVPDYSKNFELFDYSTLWEEHITYFTPDTFKTSLQAGGYEIIKFIQYQYDMQDYLVAIAKPRTKPVSQVKMDAARLAAEKQRIETYSEAFTNRKNWYRDVLLKYKKQGKVALFGAGHLACHFINLLQLDDVIDFLLDDHPHKCGMFMPGSQLPILPTSTLNESVKLCLLSLSQESEHKVVQNKKDYLDKGGVFASIFPTSKIALMPEAI